MAKRMGGYFLWVIGFADIAFFRGYKGQAIPYPILFHILGYVLIVAGLLMLLWSKKSKGRDAASEDSINYFKTISEKIILNIDNCDFKTSAYHEEAFSSGNVNVDMYDSLYSGTRRYETTSVDQTVIVYTQTNVGSAETFISPPFAIDHITLKTFIMQQKVILYIDRRNRSNYYFEITE